MLFFVGHVCQSRFQQISAVVITEPGCQKGTKFGTLVVQALLYISAKNGELWCRGSTWDTTILEAVKKFCNTFRVHCLAEHDEIWQNEGHW